jgi:hypothetical protein
MKNDVLIIAYAYQKRRIALYDKEDINGTTPLFYVNSSDAVLLLIKSFQDLKLVKRKNGYPLLYRCIARDIVNKEVISVLKKQLRRCYRGWTPISFGK